MSKKSKLKKALYKREKRANSKKMHNELCNEFIEEFNGIYNERMKEAEENSIKLGYDLPSIDRDAELCEISLESDDSLRKFLSKINIKTSIAGYEYRALRSCFAGLKALSKLSGEDKDDVQNMVETIYRNRSAEVFINTIGALKDIIPQLDYFDLPTDFNSPESDGAYMDGMNATLCIFARPWTNIDLSVVGLQDCLTFKLIRASLAQYAIKLNITTTAIANITDIYIAAIMQLHECIRKMKTGIISIDTKDDYNYAMLTYTTSQLVTTEILNALNVPKKKFPKIITTKFDDFVKGLKKDAPTEDGITSSGEPTKVDGSTLNDDTNVSLNDVVAYDRKPTKDKRIYTRVKDAFENSDIVRQVNEGTWAEDHATYAEDSANDNIESDVSFNDTEPTDSVPKPEPTDSVPADGDDYDYDEYI